MKMLRPFEVVDTHFITGRKPVDIHTIEWKWVDVKWYKHELLWFTIFLVIIYMLG